ncbi:universal stress protein [Sphingosinicella sp. BN140058]|uniref:universal stress protein n=1 Tax=Sphingosinicella sp. BN140058 TaxID=1892855 RepID=UPI0013EB2EF5|nr:universal stress protein [Sphingosinicella sp. BN140058]
MTSILLYANDDPGFDTRLAAAMALAGAAGGHVTCVQARPFNTFVVADPFGGVYAPAALMEKIEAADTAHQERSEALLRAGTVAWDWQREDGEPAQALIARSSLADAIVISVPGNDPAALALASEVALHARSAVLAVPRTGTRFDPATKMMVAWNGSAESAHALRHALPLLRLAGGVDVVSIAGGAGRFAAADAAAYLAGHGIAAGLVERRSEGRRPAEALVETAASLGAGTIVMGAYGHTRMREAVLGGTTRDMLRQAALPLVLAH